MNLLAFYDKVEAHPGLEGVGIDQNGSGKPELIVKHVVSGTLTKLAAEAVEAAEWPELEALLTVRREARVLEHMTRVVGYFSRVENWNKSKLGELKDRHKGNYAGAELLAAGQDAGRSR